MTRINVVPVQELTNKHLQGEYHEITRVFGLVRKAQERGINKYNIKQKLKVPSEYTLGTGHVLFFYDKLNYILSRYTSLCIEMGRRGFNTNPIGLHYLTDGIRQEWFGNYIPTSEAIKINRERIEERLAA